MSNEFRFFDSRLKYLLFVTTTNEKNRISEKIAPYINNVKPKKPAIKIFDAGLGDGTLLMSLLRNFHSKFPAIPFLVVTKEISMEDVRLSVEKLSDRFIEHPNLVFVVTNLHYNEASSLSSKNFDKQKKISWNTLELKGNSSYEFNQQLSQLDSLLQKNWEVEKNITSGNPTYKIPSVLIIYRQDQKINLDKILPEKNHSKFDFDFIIASQPYRSRISLEKKIKYVISPMIDSLAPNGQLIVCHAFGNDSGMEIINKIWPNEIPFPSLGKDIISYLKDNLNNNVLNNLIFHEPQTFRYNLRSLPNEIENGISTSLIFSSWNAITYVAQINNEKILIAEENKDYIKYIRDVISKYGGLWFNDEILFIKKKE